MDDEHDGKSLPSTLYTEEYFLTACEGYDEFLASEGAQLSRRLNDAFAVAEVVAGMRVLDVGCGRGEILRHCMRAGIEVVGRSGENRHGTDLQIEIIRLRRATVVVDDNLGNRL